MIFCSTIKEELAIAPSEDSRSCLLELFGMLKFRGSILLSGSHEEKNRSYVFHISPVYVTRRVLSLLKRLGYRDIEASYELHRYFERQKSFTVTIPMDVFNRDLWEHFRIDSRTDDWQSVLNQDTLYIGDFLRGCFLVGGYISDPKRLYHLELIEKESDGVVRFIAETLKTHYRMTPGIVLSAKGYKFYIKSVTDMIALLELMGAAIGAQKIETIADQRKVKADFNRTINFTLANANKTARSNFKQIWAIRTIQKTLGLSALDAESREIAQLRLNNEDLSLSELDTLMKNPIGKSALYNRLKKMIKLAHQLDEEEE
ncbi:MAG: DNA-binding protein WhiA [Thermotogota bacterium]|nr:DNA-binding protein WhiA [Thermotogota bacterium]